MKIRSKIISALVLSLISTACAKNHESDKPKNDTQATGRVNEPSKAFLIQGIESKVFQDTSSELRCNALKDYFAEFSSRALDNGRLENFACEDRTFRDRDDYAVKIQLVSGDRTAVLFLNLFGPTLSNPNYCKLPFSNSFDEICSSNEIYYSAGKDQNQQSGLMHANMDVFRDFVIQYLDQPQTQDHAFGINVNDFAAAWTAKLNAGEKLSSGSKNKVDLGLRFSPEGDNVLKGAVEITDINEDALAEQGILGCKTRDCLIGKSYAYVFNGHWLSLRSKEWYLAIPLTKP
ncbi:MAG TPA: hypothetical protein VE954_08525 [Oligoflexus sp.]|uniref:hypothetical protein n=1 Tax=Oligoflexus sp. TaxID=1971216 RepID=UPI002D26F72B|nr:hypothetical protein [Oligoflexus sp.]HYX33148.1 hypothetical protein [Oligoflexus sp.]